MKKVIERYNVLEYHLSNYNLPAEFVLICFIPAKGIIEFYDDKENGEFYTTK